MGAGKLDAPLGSYHEEFEHNRVLVMREAECTLEGCPSVPNVSAFTLAEWGLADGRPVTAHPDKHCHRSLPRTTRVEGMMSNPRPCLTKFEKR